MEGFGPARVCGQDTAARDDECSYFVRRMPNRATGGGSGIRGTLRQHAD